VSADIDLTSLVARIHRDAVGICTRLRDAGKHGWIVGGCVRDLLLGKEVNDWDIATDARPEEVMRMFPRVLPTGIEHGTVSVILHGDHMTLFGELLTAGVVAGGSKASLKLFRDVMGVENEQAQIARQQRTDAFESKVAGQKSTEAK